MVEESYVSFETAKLLRDKGFDAKCRYYYIQTGEMFEVDTRFRTVLTTQELLNLQIVGEKEERCVAPTLQMAMKWLREEKNIFIDVYYDSDIKGYLYSIIKLPKGITLNVSDLADNIYEEACEAAIKYCLENLI